MTTSHSIVWTARLTEKISIDGFWGCFQFISAVKIDNIDILSTDHVQALWWAYGMCSLPNSPVIIILTLQWLSIIRSNIYWAPTMGPAFFWVLHVDNKFKSSLQPTSQVPPFILQIRKEKYRNVSNLSHSATVTSNWQNLDPYPGLSDSKTRSKTTMPNHQGHQDWLLLRRGQP